MRPTGRLAVCAALLLRAGSACAAADDDYLAELIAKANRLHLAQRAQWLKLVHYVPDRISSGVHGLVVTPAFYNAPDGMTDPQAELEATLRSFYSEVQETDKQQNPQCRFIARFSWLNSELGFDPQRLPMQTCARYMKWHAALDPAGITLIFAAAYMNSPSSMFGHTFLRIDAKDQTEATRLLAYSINFAAATDETSGIAFAVNGLFGGYPGVFSISPYYAKVREYSDLENRDIWEYQLNLAAEEIDRVLMHAWELGPVQFRYYFSDQNCSYQLLGLLQVARPQLDLTSRFHWWAMPSDTVRAVTSEPQLIGTVVYRPANATVIRRRLQPMNGSERETVKKLSLQRIVPGDAQIRSLHDDRAAAVIEAAEDYVAYRRAIGKDDVPDAAALEHELIVARSRLDVVSPAPEVPTPEVRPDQGHGSSRIWLGTGRWDRGNFQELGGRGAYHDVMDADGGYVPGAQIEFLNLALRHYVGGATRIEDFTPVGILSLTPRDQFFKPISWSVEAGWRRVRMADGSEPLVFRLDGGAGATWSNERATARCYALLDAGLRLDPSFSSGYQFGGGVRFGALLDPRPGWRIHPYVRGLRYVLGQQETPWSAGVEQRFSLGRDLALRADLSHDDEFRRSFNNGGISLVYYF